MKFDGTIDVAQLKLSNGSEIICEIMEYAEEGQKEMIVRNVMTIAIGEYNDGERYYMFKPWIHYLESNEEYTLLNSDHVISINRPNKILLNEYRVACKEMHKLSELRNKQFEEYEQERAEMLMAQLKKITGLSDSSDVSSAKIVKFPTKDDIIH